MQSLPFWSIRPDTGKNLTLLYNFSLMNPNVLIVTVRTQIFIVVSDDNQIAIPFLFPDIHHDTIGSGVDPVPVISPDINPLVDIAGTEGKSFDEFSA